MLVLFLFPANVVWNGEHLNLPIDEWYFNYVCVTRIFIYTYLNKLSIQMPTVVVKKTVYIIKLLKSKNNNNEPK